ncbi:ABC-2 family transporter protein [Clostridium cavendishii DSM 21758]|uniref:ABC-2 family transporter protein n=1 Tax=Clostridium cavendishii DSM 21758 TaxID=1121302 RepID=A0A1M6H1G0_9CLOT|nr:ABC transporter permease [Clostridium cavendishii]SHJ15954.1 ABC-2 family transporter protein [Clostridium cavendishii DSM 21758]
MNNLIRGELYKFKKSRYIIITILLTLGFAIYSKSGLDFHVLKLTLYRKYAPIYGIDSISFIFNRINYTIFIFALLAGEFIAKDFNNSNITKTFTYGYKRSTVIMSKLVVLIPFFLILQLVHGIILITYASKTNGFCEILDYNTILYLVRLIVVGLLSNLAVISIVTMFALITKNNYYTIALTSIFLITCRFQDTFLDCILPHLAAMNALEPLASQGQVITSISFSILTCILAIGGSLLYIKRSDIR